MCVRARACVCVCVCVRSHFSISMSIYFDLCLLTSMRGVAVA